MALYTYFHQYWCLGIWQSLTLFVIYWPTTNTWDVANHPRKLILKIACTILLNNIIVLKTVIERIIYFSGLLISFYFLRHFVIWPMYRQNNIPASLFFTAKFNCSLFEGVFPFIYPEILFGLLEKAIIEFLRKKMLRKWSKTTLIWGSSYLFSSLIC